MASVEPSPSTPANAASPEDPPAYVYAAADIRPRQSREIELCKQASQFDWLYTGATAGAVVGTVLLNTKYLKQQDEVAVRLFAPGLIGLSWGMFLGGGYLSLPKCDPTWASGPPPEGNVRSEWPMAIAITLIATATAPAIDYIFLGPVSNEWTDTERSSRVLIAMGTGAIGSLLPYVLPPKTWAAKKEIDRIRVGQMAGGPFVSYTLTF